MALFSVYLNFSRDRRQRGEKNYTPAMAKGVVDCKLMYEDIFDRRLFVFQHKMPEQWRQYYFREAETRVLPNNKGHTLSCAHMIVPGLGIAVARVCNTYKKHPKAGN